MTEQQQPSSVTTRKQRTKRTGFPVLTDAFSSFQQTEHRISTLTIEDEPLAAGGRPRDLEHTNQNRCCEHGVRDTETLSFCSVEDNFTVEGSRIYDLPTHLTSLAALANQPELCNHIEFKFNYLQRQSRNCGSWDLDQINDLFLPLEAHFQRAALQLNDTKKKRRLHQAKDFLLDPLRLILQGPDAYHKQFEISTFIRDKIPILTRFGHPTSNQHPIHPSLKILSLFSNQSPTQFEDNDEQTDSYSQRDDSSHDSNDQADNQSNDQSDQQEDA